MQRFTDLKVWKRAHALVLDVYGLTKTFPGDERFNLTSQLRRAVLSVPTNVAEGAKRTSPQEYARFLNYAEGSLSETEYLLIVSRDLCYLEAKRCEALLTEISEIARMLYALRTKVCASGGAQS